MKPSIKRKLLSLIAPIKRIGLKNRQFSIISNNCWGGTVYDQFRLEYKTPTIGLYFFSKDFLAFISNLNFYLSVDIKPLDISKSKYKDYLLKLHGPNVCLGCINDEIEAVFLHYPNSIIACEKWNKRRKRVNVNNLIIKYNDQNMFEANDFEVFEKLPFANKLFFTANQKYVGLNNCVVFPKSRDSSNGTGIINDTKRYQKYIHLKKYLNEMLKQ